MKVGSLIELVNDNWDYKAVYNMSRGAIYPVKKVVYTVRELFLGGKGLLLEEIDNSRYSKNTQSKKEPGFLSSRFRELQSPMEINIEALLEESELV